MYGPHICGDAIDFRNDGYTLLAGSYRQNDALQLFDMRTMRCCRTYEWDGIDGGKTIIDKENATVPNATQLRSLVTHEKEEDENEDNMQLFVP